jgi:polysaccharide biosynthesis transport protein
MDGQGLVPTVSMPIAGSFQGQAIDAEFREMPLRDVREYLRVFLKYKRLAAIAFAVTFGLVVLALIVSPRCYTATAQLLVGRQSPIQLRLEDSVLRLADGDANARDTFNATQVAALQSRDLAASVIRDNDLEHNDAFNRPTSLIAWLLKPLYVLVSYFRTPVPGDPNAVAPELIDRYTLNLMTVVSVRGTDLIEVDFTTADPKLSAFLVKAHIDAFLAANNEARRTTDTTAKSFLNDQVTEAEKRFKNAEAALQSFAAEHPNVAVNQEQNSIAQRLNEVSALLTTAEADRVTLQSRRDFLAKPGDAMPYFLDEPGVQKIRLELLDLRAQIAGQDQRLGPEHPQMRELRHHERELEAALQSEIKNELHSVQSKFDAARLREERLHKQLSDLESHAISLRDVGARYDFLKNERDTAKTLYESLIKQRRDTAVNSELAPTNVRLVQTPAVPDQPSQPRLFLDLFLGFVASLIIVIGAVFGRAYFDSSVTSSEEVEEFLRLPTLASIPNFELAGMTLNGHENGASAKAELVVVQEPWSQIAEAFRTMKTAVLFSASGARTTPKVILVTSALAGEGKTVGSLNLAAALAEAGARVLLVDADFRHARCHEALGVTNARGLSTLLTDKVKASEVIQRLKAPRLYFVSAGPRPVNPAEMVESDALHQALEEWRSSFNFIVIDTAPALLVSDAIVLAQHADGVVIVVKGDETPRDLVRRARDRLVRAGAQVLGVVLNNVGRTSGDFYYDGYYHYGSAPTQEAERA